MGIDLAKYERQKAAVKINLTKKGINKPPIMRVAAAYDVSGSAKPIYQAGHFEEASNRLMAIAGVFDDNGELDAWSFDSGFTRLETAKVNDYGSYVKTQILEKSSVHKWGGTNYAPVMGDMLKFFFEPHTEKTKGGFLGFGSKSVTIQPENVDVPVLAMFITDGANTDRAETERLLRAAADKPIYWSLVGVGKNASEFDFLKRMADELPNAGFVNLSSLDISDAQLYDELICDELIEFIGKFHK